MSSAEEVYAQHVYNKLARQDLAHMRLSLQELKWIFGSYTTDPYIVVEEADK